MGEEERRSERISDTKWLMEHSEVRDDEVAIPESFLDDLVSRTDITELVSGYVRLIKRSGGNMFGLCPFHSEKTPSFSVNTDKQIYHCFGCGKGGGVINFIMEIENATFRDAVEILAGRAGVVVPESDTSEQTAGKRRRMLELNRDAARFFHSTLLSPFGVSARGYLNKRGVSKAVVTRFGIGAAPDAWSMLVDAMMKQGYNRQELIEAGLARSGRGDSGAYDMFRNRVMFPVIDVRGGVIGFSGRVLDNGEPKYINSPDTLVFNKRRNLFALNIAKKSKSGMLILVEGNIDVVSLHQSGFDCAIASLGTALTADQARLISRYTDNVVIAFDSDEAGNRAALRAIPLLEKAGLGVKVVNMGTAKDPDEFLRKNKPDAFKLLIEHSENHIEYQLLTIKSRFDLTLDEGRLSYLSAATDMLSTLYSEPEREIYSARVAREAGISAESVKNEVAKKYRSRIKKEKKDYDKQTVRPVTAAQPKDRTLRYNNEGSALAEEGIIRCLMRDPTLISTAKDMGLLQEEFTSPFLGRIYEALSKRISEGRDASEALILAELTSGEASLLTVVLKKPEAMPHNRKTIQEYIDKIRAEKYKTGDPDMELLLEIKKYKQGNDTNG